MKLTVITKNLQQSLRMVEKTTGRQTHLPVLQGILFETENGRLKLTTTNLEIASVYRIGAKIEEEGKIVVPAKIISELINQIQIEKLNLISKNDTLFIELPNYKTKINCLSYKDFPLIPSVESKNIISVNSRLLKDGISRVLEAASNSESRPEISGIFMKSLEKKLVFAATDSFRLAESQIPGTGGSLITCIIPRFTASEATRLCSEVSEEINILVSENQIQFKSESGELISKLTEGRYPDYQKIIPQSFVSVNKYQTQNLIQTIKAVSIFTNNINEVTMKRTNKQTEFFTKNSDKGEINIAIEQEGKGEDFEMNLNCQYLLEGLKNINTQHSALYYVGERAPLVLKPAEREEGAYTYLVMPLKNKEN
ncbi:MAG: DNA polymerase III subunit beta [Parcubacteria group bacterium]|nr:DNA polymerase III subunit beta [Parcubacteria group bacterium]